MQTAFFSNIEKFTLKFICNSKRICPDEISIWIGEINKIYHPPHVGVASFYPLGIWVEQKMEKKNGPFCFLPAFWLGMLPMDGVYPLTPLVCRPLDMEWNYNTNFPGSPACRWQIMGLLSLHNHVTQFLIINLFLYIFYWFCFSGELCLIQMEQNREHRNKHSCIWSNDFWQGCQDHSVGKG